MQTLIVVRMKGLAPEWAIDETRKKIMKEMEEGLLVIDDKIGDIIVNNITNGELGLEFNKEEDNEKEII